MRHAGQVGKQRKRARERFGSFVGPMQAQLDKRDRDLGLIRLTVMADYGCSGIWKGRAGGPVTPEDLGLSPELCSRANEWSAAYQAELQGVDPKAWDSEGRRIAEAIQAELGPRSEVDYRPN